MEKQEIIRLYEKHSGKKINNADNFCVNEILAQSKIYTLGFFAHDRGCMGTEILLGKKIDSWQNLMSEALTVLGWDVVDKRAELALFWVKKVILAWESALETKPDNFDKLAFQPPRVEKQQDTYAVQVWVQKPVGMRPINNYYLLEVIIGADASLKKMEVLSTMEVPINFG